MDGPPFVEVVLLLPLPRPLSYAVPAELAAQVEVGTQVLVPLQSKEVVGLVVRLGVSVQAKDAERVRPILEVLSDGPLLPAELLELVLFASTYYLAPPGEVLRTALPPSLHQRERPELCITDEGRRLLRVQDALMRRVDERLGDGERALLDQVASQAAGRLPLSRLPAAQRRGTDLKRLLERGLLVRKALRQSPDRRRRDLLVEVCSPLPDGDLGRAASQQRLLEAVQAHGGAIRLGQLASAPSGARALARELARKGYLRLTEVEIPRDPFSGEAVPVDRPPERLSPEQDRALSELRDALSRPEFAAYLLFGVTSSGKTEVYLRLIADTLAAGKNALVLVPEIALTPQLAARFRARFGNQVAVLHSALTQTERFSQWRLIRLSQLRIVVGARSAVFAPIGNLGVIVVDEEHDPSFKQEEGVRYQARDLALWRARQAEALCVLGSATPSLESFQGVQTGRLRLLRMRQRATPRPLPTVEIVDLRIYKVGRGVLSAPLTAALEQTLSAGEQAILFLNRRGFSNFVLCKGCGEVINCKNCSVSLTYHKKIDKLVCHYCGYFDVLPDRCPSCAAQHLEPMGLGTEQVEQMLAVRFPGARVARLDRDSASDLRPILARMGRHEVDILIGTQMVTKGHDFPDVTLVGVLCADLGLHFPDFRAAERTFQLLTQVAGRAGRGNRPGRVLVQTYDPTHLSIRCAASHDYEAFFHGEIEARRELAYPPAAYLAAVHLDAPLADAAAEAARTVARRIEQTREHRQGKVTLLGPTEAPIQKLKGRSRFMLLIKAVDRQALRQVLGQVSREEVLVKPGPVRLLLDIDPQSML